MAVRPAKMGPRDPSFKKKKDFSVRDKGKRSDVKSTGPETDGYTAYDHNVKFENVAIKCNITSVKEDGRTFAGVLKGGIVAGVPITVPKTDSAATMQGAKKRVDHPVNKTDDETFLIGHRLVMDKIPSGMEKIRVDGELMREFLGTCAPAKAARLVAASEQPQWNSEINQAMVFSKMEVLLKEYQSQPRVIFQGTEMYNLLMGCVIMVLAQRFGEVFSLSNPLNVGNRVIFAPGVSKEKIGEMIYASPGEVVESDLANNDGTQSLYMRRCEAMAYKKMGAPDWFVREFASCEKVFAWTRFGVQFVVDNGKMLSGRVNTTLGNSYTNMCLTSAALKEAEVVSSTCVIGGDDFLGVVEGSQKFLEVLPASVEKSGMKAKAFKPKSKKHGTFYRTRFVQDNNGVAPVPQFGRVVAKINVRANMNSAVNDRDYMAGKYMSAAYEHRHVPVIADILLQTADELSSKPYYEKRSAVLRGEVKPDDIRRIVNNARPIEEWALDAFCEDVYNTPFTNVVDAYTQVAQSALDYAAGWTFIDAKKKWKTKSGYVAPVLCGEAFEALLAPDI